MRKIKILANVCLIIALYYLTYYAYAGLLNPVPSLGDSWDYHIPIARTILDGRFLHPFNFEFAQWYYPGSAESINALFILFRIPLTLSNIFATIVLFFCLWKFALVFRLKYYYALIFALTFITLNVIIRWLNAVSIDVWVGVFFTLAIILLESPKKKLIYFVKLGFVLGMLIGSKYTGVLFVIPLAVLYARKLIPLISISRITAFVLPFSIFGLFWYIRNFLFTNNPFYPLTTFGLRGKEIFGDHRVWNTAMKHPVQMFDSAFAEYKLWFFVIFIAVGWMICKYIIKRNYHFDLISKLFTIGLINSLFYLTFVTSEQPWIMVSSFRYSFPAFIPLILGVFLLAAKYRKEEIIGYIAIGNMIMVTSLAYYPKLILFYLPITAIIFYFINKYKDKSIEKTP